MEIEKANGSQQSKNGARLVGPRTKDQGPVEDLLEATKALTGLIQEESRLLKERRIREIKPFQQEKPRLTAAYEEALGNVRADLTVLGKDGSRARRDLQNATQEFQDTLCTFIGYRGSGRDVTASVEAERAIQASEAQLRRAPTRRPTAADGW